MHYEFFRTSILVLPNGDLLYGNGSGLWEFTPATGPQDSWQPTVASVSANADKTYTLTGTQLNGIDEGSGYGDDVQNATNYPIVQLTSATNVVYYARTFGWTSQVATGSSPETTNFTLPTGLPGGSYSLRVIANGIASAPFTFSTLGVTGSTPASGALVLSPPTSFAISFNEAIANPATVAASALQVNGTPATSVAFNAANTIATFAFATSPVTTQGTQTMALSAGALTGQDGGGNMAFSSSFSYFAPTPLNYTASAGSPTNYTLRLDNTGTTLQLVDGSNRVLAGVLLGIVSAVNITGHAGGSDALTIDYSDGYFSVPGNLTFSGGGSGTLRVIGTGASTGIYDPDGQTTGAGTLTVTSGGETDTLAVSGIGPVEVSSMASYTFQTPNAANVVSVNAGTGSGGQSAEVIAGSSNGLTLASLTFFNVTNFTVDTGSNDGASPASGDAITLGSGGQVAQGLQNFTVQTGSGNDTLTVDSTLLALPVSGGTFQFNAGPGTNTIAARSAASYTLSNSNLTSSAGGSIQLVNVHAANLSGAQGNVSLPVNLVSWYQAEGNASDSAGSNNGTLVNGATYATGQVGQAFSFDGVSNYLQATTNGFPTGNSDRSIDLWVNMTSASAPLALFAAYGTLGQNGEAYELGAQGTQLFFSNWGNAVFGPSLRASCN